MKILHTIGAEAVLLAIILVVVPFPSAAATNADYCQAPPLKSEVSPNIMLTIDASGSMSWPAYFPDGYSDAQRDAAYDAGSQYEGYFDPLKNYKLVSGIYEETPGTGIPCTTTTCKTWTCSRNNTGGCDSKGTHGCSSSRYACCTAWNTTGDCGLTSGNYLNYKNMHRVDLVRWAMTGGRPSTCTGSAAFNGNNCDPEVWANSGNATKVGSVCKDSLDVDGDGVADGGCILLADNDTKVKVRWDRVNTGLAFQFAKMPVVPRMGAMFYSGTSVRADKVYIGDFTGAGSKTAYKFYNLITLVNSQDPNGGTPTGPAMWDTFNYFAMKDPQYGGFAKQSGSGDKWKNPMYTCDNGGANCVFLPCTDSFVILMSDGSWNSPSCSINDTGSDPVKPAYQMHNTFKNVASNVDTKVRGVYTIGLFLGGTGEQSLKNTAMYGSFDNTSKTWPSNLTGYPNDTCSMDDCGSGRGSGCEPLPASSVDWDGDADNEPDTFFSGSNADEIKDSIMNAVLEIMTKTSAGTAASVLASREGSGASLLQAVYYPKKPFTNATIDWVGNLQNLWYYIDPLYANSNIREDGRDASGNNDFILNLKTNGTTQKDYIARFFFDSGKQTAMVDRWTDNNGDASINGETKFSPINVDAVSNVWQVGQQLWSKTFFSRNVFTANVSGTPTSNKMLSFYCLPANCPNAAVLAPYLNATDSGGMINTDVASTIMQWTMGLDYAYSGTYVSSFRKRKATIGGTSNIWKLGDIIHSTPKISTWQPLGDYNVEYTDGTYGPAGVNDVYQSTPPDNKSYITTARYKGRGMVYTGANDGMLHAFRLGLLQSKWTGQDTAVQKAQLTNKVCSASTSIYCSSNAHCPGTETCTKSVTLGEEAWAFIPKNALPYLKYIAEPNYCHIYTVDLTPVIFDASFAVPTGCGQANYYDCIKQTSSWRTVLIGGMRLGGGCRETSSTCTDCVKTPINDPDTPAKGLGYSSYFALDITDQDNPVLMWEYDGTVKNSDGTYTNKLGFSFSGPAVARISNTALGGVTGGAIRNGKWFVAFGSGPTGPINMAQKAFLGKSDQNLTVHIFDLAEGPGVDNVNVTIKDTEIANAFSGSMAITTVDLDPLDVDKLPDYSDDVLYVPYTFGATGLNGGVGRLVTKGNLNPANWTWSDVITGTGPVTVAPQLVQSNKTGDVWIVFGTGRYFFDTVTGADDADPAKRRQLISLKDRCINAKKDGFLDPCPAALVFCASPAGQAICGSLTNVDNISVANDLDAKKIAGTMDPGYVGWYINLDPALPAGAPTVWGQRMVTNASVSKSGIAYFTTFKPQNDPCYKAGKTNIWATKYDTGGSATGLIKGTAIIQVSTGSIVQINLKDAFTLNGGRMSADIDGMPPEGEGLTTLSGSRGVSKLLFMKER